MKRLRKYAFLAAQTLQASMAYRTQFVLSLLSGLIQALVLYYIWRVVYLSRELISGYTLSDMVTYVFVSFAARNFYSFRTETAISAGIRDGSVAIELVRPMSYQLARFSESLGSVVVEGAVIGAMVLALGGGLFGMRGPASAGAAFAFGISLLLSLLVSFSLSYVVGLVSFWTTTVYGIVNSKRFVVDFLSGGLVPLALFPDWLARLARVLPFRSIVDVPVSLYLGRIAPDRIAWELASQAMWAALLWCSGSLLWLQARKKITIHGG